MERDLAAINRLPQELLVLVLLAFALPNWRHWPDTLRNLHLLAQVCKYWLALIKEAPPFWAELDGHFRKNEWERNLRKSASHPLSIYIDFSQRPRPGFMVAVSAEVSRWQFLVLSELDPGADIAFLKTSPMPDLETLSLCGDGRIGEVAVDLDGMQAPKLRDLTLWYAAPSRWSASIFCGLRKLKIESLSDLAPPVSQLLDILECCSSLQSLSLDSLDLGELKSGRRVLLTQLEALHLDVEDKLMEYLLNTLELPRCRIYRIHPGGYWPTLGRSLGLHLLPSFQHYFQMGNTAGIIIDHFGDLQLTVDSVYSFKIEFHLFGEESNTVVDAMFELVGMLLGQSSTSTELSPEVTATFDPGFSWSKKVAIKRLRNLHHVNSLVLGEKSGDSDVVLQALLNPAPGTGERLCPKLSKLWLKPKAEWTTAALLTLVKSRRKVPKKSGMPTRLTSLVIDKEAWEEDQATFTAIRRIMGDGLQWPGFEED